MSSSVSVGQLKSGYWRAYILSERTPGNRNSNWATDVEVVRDGYGYIISGATKVALIESLKTEHPNWKWLNS